jgi:hypothetical protein
VAGLRFGTRHILILAAAVLAAFALRATETYTTRYQTLPTVDWLESRPPLAQAQEVPLATDLSRGLLGALPLLEIRDDARPLRPIFGPPSTVQRTIGGVRDAARIDLGPPGSYGASDVPVAARLDVIVFNREVRAEAWAGVMAFAMDRLDPHTGSPQVRLSPTEQGDKVWVIAPRGDRGGIATVVGTRGPVGFVLQMTYKRPDAQAPEDRIDLTARAEAAARQAATDWSAWLESELARVGVAS